MSNLSLRSHMSDFNEQFQIYQKGKSEGIEKLLNRYLTFICASDNLDGFQPDILESCQFYLNMYKLLADLDPTSSDLLLTAISALRQAALNSDAHTAIVNQFKYLPVLTKITVKLSTEHLKFQEKLSRLLNIIQDLSYGIEIKWKEPYLGDLIQLLIDYINREDSNLGMVALSILTNICYKNLPAICLLMRNGSKPTDFIKKIKNYGILTSKMLIILDNKVDLPQTKDLHYFIEKSFLEMSECIRNSNVPYLRHIVEFLTDTKNNGILIIALKEYRNFPAHISNILKSIDNQMETDDTGNNDNKNHTICIGLLFELIDCLLHFDNTLALHHQQIFEVALNWCDSRHASAKSLHLIQTIIQLAMNQKNIHVIITKLPAVLPKLLTDCENNESSHQNTVALMKLITTLVKHAECQEIVLSAVPEKFFDKLFVHLTSQNHETLPYAKMHINEVSKYLYSLLALAEFSTIKPKVWFNKLAHLFQMKQIHFVIAKGIISTNEKLCSACLELSKISNFPKEHIAEVLSSLNSSTGKSPLKHYPNNTVAQQEIDDYAAVTNFSCNSSLEICLDQLISHIFEVKRTSGFNNVATSELIELFEYKTNLCHTREKDLSNRLEAASNDITNLSHANSLLSVELSSYQSMNFKLHLTLERLQAENLNIQKHNEQIRQTYSETMQNLSSERIKYQSCKNVLETQITDLSKKFEECRKSELQKTTQVEKLRIEAKNLSTAREALTNQLQMLECVEKEKKQMLEKKEIELVKTTKLAEDFQEKNLKLENLIKHLEEQITEKDELIKSYKSELDETEEMRKTILSLMHKKPTKNS